MIMKFERLPNEILLDVFEYFDGLELLLGFADLNAHFDALLYQRFVFYRFNFDDMPKRHFDMICQQHLPQLSSQIVAVKLNEDLISPGKIDLFFSHIPSSSRFPRLRSLSISNLHSNGTKSKLLEQLPFMITLTHFHLRLHKGTDQNEIDSQLLINCVWSLPNLVRFDLNERIRDRRPRFVMPSIVSSSLQHFSTLGRIFLAPMLDQLFQYTPNLRSFRALVTFSDTDIDAPSTSFSTLTKLTISIIEWPLSTKFFSLVQNMPNLRHLDIDQMIVLIDGHQWQQLIRTHLPKLKIFKFCMESIFDGDEKVERLMDTFRSSFWITERQWFVQCVVQERQLVVQTVSKWNYRCYQRFPRLFKSTDPQDSLTKFFDQLTCVYEKTFFDHPFPADIRFRRISSLSLKFPIPEQFWQVVPDFEQLTCLSISSYANRFASQLQSIFNRASRLRSLSIDQEASEPMDISWSERANTFITHFTFSGRTLNEEECRALSRSPLGQQCESLNLRVEHYENIFLLVNAMPKLQSLFLCQCFDEDSLQWLRDQLPPRCLISRSIGYSSGVRIWLS